MIMITRYQKRISGPSMGRIDLPVGVPCVEYKKLTAEMSGEPSAVIHKRVEVAGHLTAPLRNPWVYYETVPCGC